MRRLAAVGQAVGAVLVGVLIGAGRAARASESRFSFYSESAMRPSLASNETQFRYSPWHFLDSVELYAGARVGQYVDLSAPDEPRDGFVALYPGVRARVPRLPVTAFAEYWQVLDTPTHPRAEGWQPDVRLGFYLYHWQDLDLGGLPPRFFSETYGEGVYSSRLESNVFFSGWTKFGRRFALGANPYAGWSIDPYLEVAARRDRMGYAQENLQELKPSVRVNLIWNSLGASLQLGHAWGTTSSTVRAEGAAYHEWKGLLALTGEL